MEKRKRINNFTYRIGLFLILGSTFFLFYFLYTKYEDKTNTENIINELFINVDNTTISDNLVKKSQIKNNNSKYKFLTDNYLGYIEFSGIKRLIATGTNKKVLDKGLVGTFPTSANLDDEVGNIILAGHNNKNIFNKLHYLKIGNQIKIVTHKNIYLYEVKQIETISENDMSYFNKVLNKKILTLVTCKNDSRYRLIVIAEIKEREK